MYGPWTNSSHCTKLIDGIPHAGWFLTLYGVVLFFLAYLRVHVSAQGKSVLNWAVMQQSVLSDCITPGF
jgi:hypothetical protein